LIGFGVVMLGARYDPRGALIGVAVFVVMLVGVVGYGYLAAAASLRIRRAETLLDLGAMLMSVFSGVAFPLTLLPGVLRVVTYLLPSTWGLDLMRHLTLGTSPLLPVAVEVGALAVTAGGFLVLGRRCFAAAERHVRTIGSLSQF